MSHFPPEILNLPTFEGRFTANKLDCENCTVLFASYPKGTMIETHTHDTNNIGVITAGRLWLSVDGEAEKSFGPGDWYQVGAGVPHTARFEIDTSEIELWFKETI